MSNFNRSKGFQKFEERLSVVTPETLKVMYLDIYGRLPELNEDDFTKYTKLLSLIQQEAILRKIDLVKPKIKI